MGNNFQSVYLEVRKGRSVEVWIPEQWVPDYPVIILTHGAGGSITSEFFVLLEQGLSAYPMNRVYFNFPYRVLGRKMPDHPTILQDSWRQVVEFVKGEYECRKLVIGGKSMGGRMASLVAGEYDDLSGLVFLGYPFHPPGRPDQLRTSHLFHLTVPMLFIQGTRDPFAKFDLIQKIIKQLNDTATWITVEQGDHSFKIPRRAGKSYAEVLYWVAQEINRWIYEHI